MPFPSAAATPSFLKLLLINFLLISAITNGQIIRMTGPTEDTVSAIVIDSDDNIIIFGDFNSGITTFTDGLGKNQSRLVNSGSRDVFVAKFSRHGQLLWAAQIDNFADDSMLHYPSVDRLGNINVGLISVSLPLFVFNASGALVATLNKGVWSWDTYIIQFSPSGGFNWAFTIAGTGTQHATASSTDTNGDIVVTFHADTASSLYDNAGVLQKTFGSVIHFDAYLMKLTSGGQLIHAFNVATGDNLEAYSGVCISHDSKGDVAFLPYIESLASNISDKAGFIKTVSHVGSADVSVLQYSRDGFLRWSAIIGGIGSENPVGSQHLPNDDLAVVVQSDSASTLIYNSAGVLAKTITKSGPRATLLVVFTSIGGLRWSARLDGSSTVNSRSIGIGRDGSIAVVGSFQYLLLVYDSANNLASNTLSNAGGNEGFIATFSSNGSFQWVATLSGISGESIVAVKYSALSDSWLVTAQSTSANTVIYDGYGRYAANITNSNGVSTDSFVYRYSSAGAYLPFVAPFTAPVLSTSTRSTIQTTTAVAHVNTVVSSSIADQTILVVATMSSTTKLVSGTSIAGERATGNIPINLDTIYIVVGVFVAGAFMCLIGSLIFMKSLRNRKVLTSAKPLTTETNTALTVGTSNTTTDMYTALNGTTLLSSDREISFPAFLKVEQGSDYIVGEEIARGGTASIKMVKILSFDMMSLSRGDQAVVKEVFVRGPSEFKAFQQEVSILWKFRDVEGFCRVFGYTNDDSSTALIILKFYSLGDLSHLILAGRSDVLYTKNLVLSILTGIAKSIREMHMAGLAHCDLKPGNILLEATADGRIIPVLTDFGLSKFLSGRNNDIAGFDAINLRGASFQYAAPEAITSLRSGSIFNVIKPRVLAAGDIYPIAVIALAMLQRDHPWK